MGRRFTSVSRGVARETLLAFLFFAACAVLFTWPLTARLTDGMVDSENSGQVFMASRFVISNRAQFETEREFERSIGTEIHAPFRDGLARR